MRRYYLPVLLLVVLLLAFLFRWHIEATKGMSDGQLHWVRDRWTGRLWLRVYGWNKGPLVHTIPTPLSGETEEQAWQSALAQRDNMTFYWKTAVALTCLWLLWAGRLLRVPSGWKRRMQHRVHTLLASKPRAGDPLVSAALPRGQQEGEC